MKRSRRILALGGVVILAALYIVTLVFALMDTPWAGKCFVASAFATILIPLILWVYLWIAKVLDRNDDSPHDKAMPHK